MSLLADLLSKIKQPQLKREVPPNLKNIIRDSAKKSTNRRRLILLSVLFAVAVSAGAYLVYLTRTLTEKPVSNTDITSKGIPASVKQMEPEGGADKNNPPLSSAGKTEDNAIPVPGKEKVEGGSEEKEKIATPIRPAVAVGKHKTEKISLVAAKAPDIKNEKDATEEDVAPDMLRATHPETEKKHAGADTYLYRAKEFEMKKDFSGALANYKKALEMEKDNAVIMNNIAYILLEMDLIEESIKYSQMALGKNKDHAAALINIGIAHAKAGDITAAGEYLKRAFSLEPDNRHVVLNLAVFHEKQKDYERASEYFTRLAQLGDAEGPLGLARIYEIQGKIEEAIKRYRDIYVNGALDERTRSLVRQRIMVLQNR
ncbi:MAG: hypothetical protein C4560_05205 [Nitrospiraceae bacterium]|nr:MAG: hypothetical protein C4560_05205 [Nitrospiraceae bacterium]